MQSLPAPGMEKGVVVEEVLALGTETTTCAPGVLRVQPKVTQPAGHVCSVSCGITQ